MVEYRKKKVLLPIDINLNFVVTWLTYEIKFYLAYGKINIQEFRFKLNQYKPCDIIACVSIKCVKQQLLVSGEKPVVTQTISITYILE